MKLSCRERRDTASRPQLPLPLVHITRFPRRTLVIGSMPGLGLSIGTPALASDEAFELWIAPSLRGQLDDNTGLRLETVDRRAKGTLLAG